MLAPALAEAYIGPGAGFAFVTSFFVLLTTLLLALLAVLSWPLRLLLSLLTRRRPPGKRHIQRMVIIGLDGLDPRLLRELIAAGRLPHLQRLAEMGGLGELGTTWPALSPVAWSTFATGVDPSRHGLFDFITRDRHSYRAVLSSTDIRPPRRTARLGPFKVPLGRPRVRGRRRAIPFWQLLGRFGVPSTILRVPITFPPDRFRGAQLSAMCVPDLLGTQGTFTYYTAEPAETERIGGRVIAVTPAGRTVRTYLPGPPHPLRRDAKEIRLPLRLELDEQASSARLLLSGRRITLRPGQYSDWVEVGFRVFPGVRLHGICRFRLLSISPLRLYVTPINIDPSRPMLPISHPFIFSIFLAKLLGPYATLGLAEDTWALNEGVIDEQAFIEQTELCQRERERMLFEMLERTPRGVLVCVFDGTDRIQHMFMRERCAGDGPHADAIERVYLQADALIGRLLARIDFQDPRNLLLALSDHGFAPFERGVNLNTWLLEKGYLTLEEGRSAPGEFLEGVDWSRTRAYAMGLAGIYLNLAGRERRGIVKPQEASSLRQEIAAGLLGLRDSAGAEGEVPPIKRVFDTHAQYSGPFLDDAPDLLVGYARGYRASWATARGMAGQAAIEPNVRPWSGDHCIDPAEVPGVIASSLPLRLAGAQMADLAPTILELFGVPVPRNMTGSSLLAGAAQPTQPDRQPGSSAPAVLP